MVSSTLFCIVVPVILIGVIIFMIQQRKRELQEAYYAYQDALRQLKAQPSNVDLRQRTLSLGRQYSNLTRQRRGVTTYDEVAMMNDINAATASTVSIPQSVITAVESKIPVEERLKQLDGLKAKGMLTEEEFITRLQQIISEL